MCIDTKPRTLCFEAIIHRQRGTCVSYHLMDAKKAMTNTGLPTDTEGTEYKRRDVLKQTATVTGGLVVSGTLISGGAAARRTGGSALTFGEDFQGFAGVRRRTPFEVVEILGEPAFFASCKSANSAVKNWTDYLIEYCDDATVSIMAARSIKQVQVNTKYEFTSAQATPCPAFPGAVKTGFKPVP